MRKLLAGLAMLGMLAVASPAQAAQGASAKRLTTRTPIVLTQNDTDGYVSVNVWHYGDGQHGDDYPSWTSLTVEIADSSGAVLATGTCDNEPYVQFCSAGASVLPGTYTVSVSVASGVAYQVVVHTDE